MNADDTALVDHLTGPIIGSALFGQRVTQAAWHTKPCFYQVSTQDNTLNPDLERFMAKRMKAKTIELDASHLGIISHPREIADLILAAAGHTG
jgi:pimeloyl-ACP methyl ester carboxylesterase